MKFGVMYNTGSHGVDPDAMIAVARHAEDRGFESFYVPEHIALYPDASYYGMAIPPGLPIADPLECLAFVARRPRGGPPGGPAHLVRPAEQRAQLSVFAARLALP